MNYKDVNDYEMLYLIKENDDDAERIIYGKYGNLVAKISMKYLSYASARGVELDDLIQEGYLGLSFAIKRYSEDTNNLFFTFANVCIERQIQTYCRRLSALKHNVLNNSYSFDHTVDGIDESFLEILGADDGNPIRMVAVNDFINEIIVFKNELHDFASQVFELRMNGFSYKEMAKLLDCPITTIDSYLCKIRRKLRLSCLKDELSII